MSFSDFRRSKKVADSSSDAQSPASSRGDSRGNPLSHFRRSTHSNSEAGNLEPSQPIQEEIESLSKVPVRGVRPRFHNVVNPITAKPLFPQHSNSTSEDERSADSSLSGFEDLEDDSEPLPAPSAPSKQINSRFACLNQEIVNFLKMVSDLERAIQKSGESPEAQWKTKILIRSCQEAEKDITQRLHKAELEGKSKGQMALRKLQRDFSRVNKQFLSAMAYYEKRQNVEVSFLNVDGETKEEFFDRAMREREEEINNIHNSMNKVNTIYKDLAGLVDGQQDQIDQLAETLEESKVNTRQGMEYIHESIAGMCGPNNDGGEVPEFWSMEDLLDMTTSCHQTTISLCAMDDEEQYY